MSDTHDQQGRVHHHPTIEGKWPAVDKPVVVVPKAALSAAEAERDEWKLQHGYAMGGQESWKHTAERNLARAERAEAALAEALRDRCTTCGHTRDEHGEDVPRWGERPCGVVVRGEACECRMYEWPRE